MSEDSQNLFDNLFDKDKYKKLLSEKLYLFIQQLQKISEIKESEIISTIKELGNKDDEGIEEFIINYKEVYNALQLNSNEQNNKQFEILESLATKEDDYKLSDDELLFISNFKLEATTCCLRIIVLIESLKEQSIGNKLIGEYIYEQLKQMPLNRLFPIKTFVKVKTDENNADADANICIEEISEEGSEWNFTKVYEEGDEWNFTKVYEEGDEWKFTKFKCTNLDEKGSKEKTDIEFKQEYILISDFLEGNITNNCFYYTFEKTYDLVSDETGKKTEKESEIVNEQKENICNQIIKFFNYLKTQNNDDIKKDDIQKKIIKFDIR